MRRIAVVTSGGDAPGMNAATRAMSRLAAWSGLQVIGYLRGWVGLIRGNHIELDPRAVSGILHLGGTILRSTRCEEFKTREGLEKASQTLAEDEVDALVVIGGDGSARVHMTSASTRTPS